MSALTRLRRAGKGERVDLRRIGSLPLFLIGLICISFEPSHADSGHESTPTPPVPQIKPDKSSIVYCNPPTITQNCVIGQATTGQMIVITQNNRPPIIDAVPNGLKPK